MASAEWGGSAPGPVSTMVPGGACRATCSSAPSPRAMASTLGPDNASWAAASAHPAKRGAWAAILPIGCNADRPNSRCSLDAANAPYRSSAPASADCPHGSALSPREAGRITRSVTSLALSWKRP